MADYRQGLTADQALQEAEAGLRNPGLTADECQVLALQVGGHLELHEVSSCLFALAGRLARKTALPEREWKAAWGATIAAVRTEIEQREEVAHAA
jgi:Rps23 Pro-64 3,4-dihydroxylase Tpa1-like proline 4-hydroxylase